MKKGRDVAVELPGLYLVHHNLPEKHHHWHSHPEYLLFLPLQGEIRVATRSRDFALGPGKMLFLPGGEEHAFKSHPRQGERLIALIKPSLWKSAQGCKSAAAIVPANQLCKELLFYLLLNPKSRHARSLAQAFAQTLSEALEVSSQRSILEVEHLASQATDPRLQKALEYMQATLTDHPSIEEVARAAGLSVRNMNRLLLSETGMKPKQAMTQYRIARAKELLRRRLPVTDVALEVGYQSLSQFISVFRRITGQLPSEFARHGRN